MIVRFPGFADVASADSLIPFSPETDDLFVKSGTGRWSDGLSIKSFRSGVLALEGSRGTL